MAGPSSEAERTSRSENDRTTDPSKTALSPHPLLLELLVLAAIMGLVAALRAHFLAVPLERDEGDYALGGWLLFHGHPLYRDFYTMRLPGVYLTYGAIQAIFGHSVVGIHTALLLVNSATIALIYFIGRSLFNPTTGLCAALVFGVASSLIVTLGQAANSEHFINLWVAIGLAAIIASQKKETLRLIIAGVAMGFAFITKQHAALLIVLGWIWLAAVAKTTGTLPLFARQAAKYAAAVLILIALTAIYVATSGVFDSFKRWAFEYAGIYVGTRTFDEGMTLLRAELSALPWLIWPILLLALVGVVGTAMAKSERVSFAMVFGYLLVSLVMFSIGLYFRAHYFLFVYPPLALFAGKGIELISRRITEPRISIACAAALAILATGYPIFGERTYFFEQSPQMIARSRYGINPFPESEAIARYIAERTQPDEKILVLGSEPQIYWYARRAAATPHPHMYPLMEARPLALEMQDELIRQAEAARPQYIVLVSITSSWFKMADSPPRLLEWYEKYSREHYAVEAWVDIPHEGIGEVKPFNPNERIVSAHGNYILILKRTD